jgi:ABC-type dipeptide/oligopeptide/nickel transport system permease component
MAARGLDVSQAQIAYLQQQYGLDKPLYPQYFRWARL